MNTQNTATTYTTVQRAALRTLATIGGACTHKELADNRVDPRVRNALVRAGAMISDGVLVALSDAGWEASGVAKPQPAAEAAKAAKEGVPCLCGCGLTTKSGKRMFLQGHDMKLRSAVQHAVRTGGMPAFTGAQITYSLGTHWCTDAIRAALTAIAA